MYCGGKTEKILGELKMGSDSVAKIACKVNPIGNNALTEQSLRSQFHLSLERLKAKSVDILYLHMPDHNTEIAETLEGINKLYLEKKFQRFGLSNYSSWQVMEIYHLCKQKGYVLPTVYQGMYNAITRQVEEELFPCLKRLNIAFYCYNPLAGGLLSGKYKYVPKDDPSIPKGRFNGVGGRWAGAYRDRFWNKENFDGIDIVKKALVGAYGGEEKVSMVDAALRWLVHHSKMVTRRFLSHCLFVFLLSRGIQELQR
uniref:NADP-dependent oxidoreductase domain-containing protein n=1 Tax=Lotharella oceanica TaxID=641309 RepID=A0A7S2TPV6_9EUKA